MSSAFAQLVSNKVDSNELINIYDAKIRSPFDIVNGEIRAIEGNIGGVLNTNGLLSVDTRNALKFELDNANIGSQQAYQNKARMLVVGAMLNRVNNALYVPG